MTKKKKGKGKGNDRAEKGLMSLETVNSFRRAGGMKLLDTLPPYLIPAPAPSLVTPFPNEGAPLEERQSTPLEERQSAPLEERQNAPLEERPKSAPLEERSPLEKPSLEKQRAQASPEEETVLDGALHHSDASEENSDGGSELDWGNDSVLASALLGMNRLESSAAQEELVSAPISQWTFDDEQPQTNRAESEGTWVLSTAGNHKIWVPNHERAQDSTPALHERAPYPTFGEEHNNDVDYSGDSPSEDGSTILENPATSSEDNNPTDIQNSNPTTVVQTCNESNGNGKEEEDPDPRLAMGVGDNAIATRTAVLTQAIV